MDYLYACIDESGDTGYTKKSSRYFIVTAVLTDDIIKLRRIAKDIHKYKIDKRKASTLHAYKETKIVKNKFIEKLKNNDTLCIVSILDKRVLSRY